MRNTRRRQRANTTTRTTRKYKQRGGADWAVIPEPRKTDWAAKLGADFNLITGDGTGEEVQHVNQYLNVIRRQNELFEVALKIIGEKLDVNIGDAGAILAKAAIIDASGKELFEYIIDVERMIQLKEDNNWSIVRTANLPKDATKLQMMYMEPLSTLLLFPSRLTNMFILSLARIIVDLSDPANLLIAQAVDKATHPILADQFKSLSHSMAYTLTARDLRDGYFLNQAISEFQIEVQDFWGNFIEGAVRLRDISDGTMVLADKGAPCKTQIAGEDSWGLVAAKMMRLYQLGQLDNILTLFADCSGSELHSNETYTPPDSALDAVFDSKGTTMRKLYRNMEDTTLQFILQLTYTIQQLIQSESTSTAANSTTTTTTTTKEDQTVQPNSPENAESTVQTAQ